MRPLFSLLAAGSFILVTASCCFCQVITTPTIASPAAMCSQTIGISTVTVKYSRPSVNKRKIWGELVPYGWNIQTVMGPGNLSPWRAGANENTTISFSNEAKVGGQIVPAGTYGLFFVINQDNSGEVILSKNNRSWGSFFYNSAEDQAKAKIQLRDIAFTESLTYDFINLTKNAAELVLNWEKKQFPVKIEFAVNEIVIANAKEELRGPVGFTADGFVSAAQYSFTNNVEVDQGMKWADKALELEPTNFDAIRVKSRFLIRLGKAAEADKLMKEALAIASEIDMNAYACQLFDLGLHDKAISLFITITERFPKSANGWDKLGEAYFVKGDKANAIKCFKKVLTLDSPEKVRANAEKYLKQAEAR